MSASAREARLDYSKGRSFLPARSARLRLLLCLLAMAGAGLLVAAELSPLYSVVVGALQTPRRSVAAGSSHGWVLGAIALVAVAASAAALRGARPAATALVALGAAVLLVALAVDEPKTRRSASLPEAVAYADARATAGRGFALELAGGAALIGAGAGLLVLRAPRRAAGRHRLRR